MPEDDDDRPAERRSNAGEEALRRVVESGRDPATVVFKRRDRRDEYVQFYLHDHLFHGEVGSREWGSPGRPLPAGAVERLAALGFLQTDANPNYVRDGLPPDPEALAQLTLDLFRAAYDVPEGLVLRVSVNLDPEPHGQTPALRTKASRVAADSEIFSASPGLDEATAPRPRALQPWQAVLPEGHICRTDDLAYQSVGEWFRAHRGRVPVQAAGWLSGYMKRHNCTFADAFAAGTSPSGPIIMID